MLNIYFYRNGIPITSWFYNMLRINDNNTWTISTSLSDDGHKTTDIFDIAINGEVFNNGRCCNNFSSKEFAINPVLYLKSNVKIISGDGTKDNPYKFN